MVTWGGGNWGRLRRFSWIVAGIAADEAREKGAEIHRRERRERSCGEESFFLAAFVAFCEVRGGAAELGSDLACSKSAGFCFHSAA